MLQAALADSPMLVSILAAVATIFVPLLLLFSHHTKKLNKSQTRIWLPGKTHEDFVVPIAFAAVALSSISQIFPVHDMYHLWWGSPVAILSVLVSFMHLVKNKKALVGTVGVLTSISIVLGLAPWRAELSEPRVQIRDGSLKYMYVTDKRYRENSGVLDMLNSVESNSATFYCRDGLVATWTGRYMASSPRYVDWAWGTDGHPRADSERVFLCSGDAQMWADQAGYRLSVGAQAHFSIFSGFVLVEAVKK